MDLKFSVLMAFYKGDDPGLLRDALQSITDNSLRPDEVFLVQDGPVSKELSAVVSEFNTHLPIKLHIKAENLGLREALNYGLQHIENEIIVRADADDINLPSRFEKLIEAITDGYDLVGSHILEKDRDQRPIALRKVPLGHAEIVLLMRNRNPFNHMTVAFRREAAIRSGGYPNLHLREDYGLWAKMAMEGSKMKNIDEVLVHATTGLDMYRRRGGLRYALAEISMQRFLFDLGVQSLARALMTGGARALVFILPSSIRGRVYELLLRSGITKT